MEMKTFAFALFAMRPRSTYDGQAETVLLVSTTLYLVDGIVFLTSRANAMVKSSSWRNPGGGSNGGKSVRPTAPLGIPFASQVVPCPGSMATTFFGGGGGGG